MDNQYAQEYERLYKQHWWWRARRKVVLDVLGPPLSQAPTPRILDIGCGDGLFFDDLSALGEVEGVEIEEAIVSARNPWRERIHVCPFDDHFQPGKRFTIILMLDVLEHLPDPQAALRHALSLLEDTGRLLITVPAFRSLWTSHDDLNHHLTRYTSRTFRNLTDGVATLYGMRYFFHWLFPMKLVVRAKEILLRSSPRPPQIPRRGINQVCYGLSRLEQQTIGRLPLPFGSSLIAVLGKPEGAN